MAKEALVENDQLFRALIEHNSDAILLIAPDGTILYANPASTRLTGYTPEDLVGMNGFALVHPADRVSLRGQVTDLFKRAEETFVLECRVHCKHGGWLWIEGTALNLLENPQVNAFMCSARDRTRSGHALMPISVAGVATEQGPGTVSVPRTLVERSRGEYQLLDAERKFRSLVESNVVGVMVTDSDGRIYEANDHIARLLGYNQEELTGGSIRMKDLLVHAYFPARARAWRTLVSQGSSLPEEKEYKRKDGSVFTALVTAATINQERTRALVMLLDISDRRNADRRKEEFLSMVSHELRTPLTIIQGFLELALFCVDRISAVASVEAGDFLSKLEAMLQQAQQQAELETRLVADLLEVSHMEMQKFEVTLRPHNLVSIVQQVVINQRQIAPTHLIELVLPTQASIPVVIDADRIDQVLTNYLTNAFKYAPASEPVRVELTLEGLIARVSVCDRGPGLTVEQQQHVWDRFYQTETAMQQGAERGLGLGLYIVRTIIAQHQGQVGVESKSGQGATFWFVLPLADESAQA